MALPIRSYIEISGDDALIRLFGALRTGTALKASRSGVLAGLVPLAKAIRQGINATSIPPSKDRRGKRAERDAASKIKREARKSIGYRMLKIGKETTAGIRAGKTGFAVAKRQPPRPKKRENEKGVGLSTSNIHWFVMGTKDRYIKTGPRAGQWTGKIRPYFDGVVGRALIASQGAVRATMAEKCRQVIEKDAAKRASTGK